MSIVDKGVKVKITDECNGSFFVAGQIVESTGEACEYTGLPLFRGEARDYPYDSILQALEPEDYSEVKMSNLVREILEGSQWRCLPLDTLPENKFVAEMVFDSLDTVLFPGHTVARGFIYNDSRGIFCDGDPVRTSTVVNIYEVDGTRYIETRNTIYKIIG